jgi:hypothetical protein
MAKEFVDTSRTGTRLLKDAVKALGQRLGMQLSKKRRRHSNKPTQTPKTA